MQSSHSTVLALTLLVGIAAGCSQPTEPSPTGPEQPVGQPAITPPQVNAGPDVWLPLPANSIVLHGSVLSTPSTIMSHEWKVLSGPPSISLESPTALRPTVANLEQGTYDLEFALTAKGFLVTDTVRLHVYESRQPAVNEVLFKNITVNCPMFCVAELANFQLAGRTPLRVLLKRDDAVAWFEASAPGQWKNGDLYAYSIFNDRLSVSVEDGSRAVDIRVIF